MISSLSNSQIKNIIQLQKKGRERKEQGVFICEGIKMFEEARAFRDGRIIKAYISEDFYEQQRQAGKNYDDLPYEIVSEQIFKEISETMTPQGILAIVKQPEHSISDMFQGEEARLLLLEDIRDPGNLGTMVRTAEGAGFTGIILSKGSVDMYNPKVIRSTMGAIFRVPFIYVDNFLETLSELKEQHVNIYAAHLEGACDYDRVSFDKKTAVLIGNEANGLSDQSAEIATRCIKIPMEGNVESLNAGIAAAILMYEVYRQKRSK